MDTADILFQAFYWDPTPPQGETWWTHLRKRLPDLADLGRRRDLDSAALQGRRGGVGHGLRPV